MPELIVALNITPEQVADYYRGRARNVVARATNGQTVQFPMAVLHKSISMDGIRGQFRLVFDENNKFVRIEPVTEATP